MICFSSITSSLNVRVSLLVIRYSCWTAVMNDHLTKFAIPTFVHGILVATLPTKGVMRGYWHLAKYLDFYPFPFLGQRG